MVLDTRRFAGLFNIFRKDGFINYRSTKVEYADGSSNNVFQAVVSSNRPCSYHPENSLVMGEIEGKPVYNLTPLFITAPGEDILVGDQVVVAIRTADADVLNIQKGTIGSITYHQTHLEANIDVEGKP